LRKESLVDFAHEREKMESSYSWWENPKVVRL
jgi:hypothetical protein